MTGRTTRPAPPSPLILVVDADADTRSLYRHLAAGVGWQIAEASDGRDGLVKALDNPPALVLTEIVLPFVDGYALCEILRRDGATAEIPILVVTAEGRASHLARVWRAGADNVFLKPVTPDVVVNEIQRLLTEPRVVTAATRSERAMAAEPAVTLAAPQQYRRKSRAKAFRRNSTTVPPASPPDLTCPSCDGALTYENSHIGGVNEQQSEQWDQYTCSTCGAFQYRHRTRKLRRVS